MNQPKYLLQFDYCGASLITREKQLRKQEREVHVEQNDTREEMIESK